MKVITAMTVENFDENKRKTRWELVYFPPKDSSTRILNKRFRDIRSRLQQEEQRRPARLTYGLIIHDRDKAQPHIQAAMYFHSPISYKSLMKIFAGISADGILRMRPAMNKAGKRNAHYEDIYYLVHEGEQDPKKVTYARAEMAFSKDIGTLKKLDEMMNEVALRRGNTRRGKKLTIQQFREKVVDELVEHPEFVSNAQSSETGWRFEMYISEKYRDEYLMISNSSKIVLDAFAKARRMMVFRESMSA